MRMRPVRGLLLLLAWSAFLVPWERCHAACHDRLEVGAHECHAEPTCPEDGDREEESRHDRVSLDSVHPHAAPLSVPPPAILPALVLAEAADVGAVATDRAAPRVTPPRTTVLLL